MRHRIAGAWLAVLLAAGAARGGDWPGWGHGHERNMAAEEKNLPAAVDTGKLKAGSEDVDLATTKNVKWVAKLGSQSYGNPSVSGGKVFVGTNNESPRDPKHQGDRGVVMCFNEADGKFLWQLVVPKLGAGKVSDWEFLGVCSTPTVDGNCVYAVTNRCEVVCLDVNGLADGNQGYADEAAFMSPEAMKALEEATTDDERAKVMERMKDKLVAPGATDADILWRFDMRTELGVFPHNIASSSVLIVGDHLYATTSNGQDWSHVTIPSPKAPTLVKLDKKTGALLGEESSGISNHLFHCNWSSPAFLNAGGKDLLIFGGGDGFLHAFDPVPVKDEEGFEVFKRHWKVECNPPEHKVKNGVAFKMPGEEGAADAPFKYPNADGPSEIIATPVIVNGRIYIAVGQDPEHGEGVGCLNCVDAAKGEVLWRYKVVGRTISTVAIKDGLLFLAEYSGKVHCLDAETGKVHWVFDTVSHVWSSTFVADGKVYLGTEDGDLWVFALDKELKVHDPATDAFVAVPGGKGKATELKLKPVNFSSPIYSTPMAANGVLYIPTQTHLWALQKK
ncbi:MAG: PQQ-binding-like beta-propeller repeat protein [Planctomycetota bacterium]|nr:PQQ-binding-like beta-propeller repeat protein [Planctomycetota bacterium]